MKPVKLLKNLAYRFRKFSDRPKNLKKVSYSQCGEDIIIKYLFDSIGIQKPSYLDIGAHTPKYLSNTYLFYVLGSTGVNIEPDIQKFNKICRVRKRDTNLNVAVADYTGEANYFIMSVPTLNTCSQAEAENYLKEGYKIISRTTVKVESIQSILEKHCNNCFPDLLTVDVEGWEEKILESIDFELSVPTVICVETISYSSSGKGIKNQRVINLLQEQGYLLYADTYINTIFVKRDKWIRS